MSCRETVAKLYWVDGADWRNVVFHQEFLIRCRASFMADTRQVLAWPSKRVARISFMKCLFECRQTCVYALVSTCSRSSFCSSFIMNSPNYASLHTFPRCKKRSQMKKGAAAKITRKWKIRFQRQNLTSAILRIYSACVASERVSISNLIFIFFPQYSGVIPVWG